MENKNIIEGLLFIKGEEGILEKEILDLLKINKEEIDLLMATLIKEYEGRGLQILKFGDLYKMLTRSKYVQYYKDYLEREPFRLSDALVETALIVAYKQPVTRAVVDQIRGVDTSDAIRKLRNLEIIEELGRTDAPGRPIIYGTSNKFLDHFGLSSLDELPDIEKKNLD